jgi:predicted peptidase
MIAKTDGAAEKAHVARRSENSQMTALGLLCAIMAHFSASGQNLPPTSAGPAERPPTPQAASQPTGFLFKTLVIGKETYAYCVYVPPEYTPEQAWPVILSLHGSGERGSDGLLQTEVGIATAIRRNRALCPAIVVMPQCRAGQLWTGQMAEMALKCLDEAAREYRVDIDRTYLTGLSLGGFGTWLLAERVPERFAAVVPICGFYGNPNAATDAETLGKLVQSLRNVPVWCFHGTLDKAVPVERSREIVGALRESGANVKYTEFADGQHDVWGRAYADAELWKWLFAQRRVAARVPASQPAR